MTYSLQQSRPENSGPGWAWREATEGREKYTYAGGKLDVKDFSKKIPHTTEHRQKRI